MHIAPASERNNLILQCIMACALWRRNIDAILPIVRSRENNGTCALPGPQNKVQTPCYFPAPTRIYNKLYQEQATPSVCRVIMSCALQGQSTLLSA